MPAFPRLRSVTLAALGLISVRPATLASQAAGERVNDFVREVVDPHEGLPDTQIAAIAQTPDGYLWLGTRRGLVRYDGLGTTLYSPQTAPGLRSWAINALMAESDGTLWISTDRGLAVLRHGTIRAVDTLQVPAGTVWKVVRDRQRRLWVTGSFGVRVGDGTRFTAVPHYTDYTYAIAEDRAGRMWFGGRGVLAGYAPGDAEPVRWAPAAGERVFDLAYDSSAGGGLWVALRDGVRQLDVSDPRRISERARVGTSVGPLRAQVWSLALDDRRALWIGTDSRGVLRYDGRTLSELTPEHRGTSDPVWWISRDSRGTMWAGTSAGLVRYRRSPFRTLTRGLNTTVTWAVRQDREGTLWMSADDGQVAWFDGTTWHRVFPEGANRTAAAISPSAAGGMLVVDDAGRMWRATRNGLRDITAASGLPAMTTYGVFEDVDGTLYSNTASGLLRRRGAGIDRAYRAFGLDSAARPRVVLRDSRGQLVVGGPYLTIGEGPARRRFTAAEGLTDPQVMAVHEAAGALWIATADSGLFVLRGSRVQALTATNRRLNRGVNGLMSDRFGFLWITSRTGLMRASLRDLLAAADHPSHAAPIRQFDRADGLPTIDFNSDYQSPLLRDEGDRIWLPTYAGPVQLDPALVVADTVAPHVFIESVSVDGRSLPLRDTLQTPSHPGRIEVTFAATNALVPQRVRAEYRVSGISDEWIDAGQRRTITFGPLNGGHYRLEIRAAGEDGDWQPQMAALDIDVSRSLAEQPWFVPLLATVGALGAFVFIRRRLAFARTREAELSALVSERTADLEAARADLEVRVAERSAALSRELAERYRLEQRLQGTRRMASLGRLAGGVSHEINNALATVLGFAQLAQMSSLEDERMQADLGEVVRAGRRAASITHQLLAFARQHHTALERVSLPGVVADNLRSLEQLCAPVGVAYTCDATVPTINADLGQIEQLLVNLVKNARDAKPVDEQVHVALHDVTLATAQPVGDRVLPAGRYAVLDVRDRGTGMAPDVLEHLFEPFFTTKDVNEGTGLGLAVVQGIVARHDGAIEVTSAAGAGTTFRVWFPEYTDWSPPEVAEREHEGGGETILLAEDDPGIRQFATRMLREHGYRVLDAEDGAAAITLVGKSIEAIDLVLTDVLMPNANGLDLARLMRAARPELPIVFMTGYAGLDDEALVELRATGPVLAKPFTQEILLRTVAAALEERGPSVGAG